MIILITGFFPIKDRNGWPTGETEFLVSHGVDSNTGETIIMPSERPDRMGGEYDHEIGEWVIR